MVFEPTVRHRRSRLSAARAACFEELAGVLASSGALHYAKIFTSLNRKYFCYQHKAVSDKKSGNSLMDGAKIVVLNKETESVRQEIKQFADGRCRNCSAKQQKQGCPTRNQAIH